MWLIQRLCWYFFPRYRKVCRLFLLSTGLHLCVSHWDHRFQRCGRRIQEDWLWGPRCLCWLSLLSFCMVFTRLYILNIHCVHSLIGTESSHFLAVLWKDQQTTEAGWLRCHEDSPDIWHTAHHLHRLWCPEGGWGHRLQVGLRWWLLPLRVEWFDLKCCSVRSFLERSCILMTCSTYVSLPVCVQVLTVTT